MPCCAYLCLIAPIRALLRLIVPNFMYKCLERFKKNNDITNIFFVNSGEELKITKLDYEITLNAVSVIAYCQTFHIIMS